MTRLALALICCASLALVTNPLAAQDSKPSGAPRKEKKPVSLDGVTWAGAGVRLDQLKGKTVVVLTYVTWCPICNEWAPEMFSSLDKVIQGKPVIVLAISTNVPPAKAKEYVERNGLEGPNVLNGSDPQLAKNLGFTNEFFNFAIIGPSGEQTGRGNAGIYSKTKEGKEFYLVQQIARAKDLGKLQFVDAGMSPELQEMLWPMELGYVAELQRSLKRAEKRLSADDRALLKTKMDQFLDDEIKAAEELMAGDPAQRIDALDKVTFLSANFKSSAQGKEAKKLLAELTKDKTMKKEISAKKMYDASMQADDPDRRVVLLEKTAKQFAGTHYGELADKAAHAPAAEAKP
jgi:AhpC/TSA family